MDICSVILRQMAVIMTVMDMGTVNFTRMFGDVGVGTAGKGRIVVWPWRYSVMTISIMTMVCNKSEVIKPGIDPF